jgi:phosphate transport system substrate-binding protein
MGAIATSAVLAVVLAACGSSKSSSTSSGTSATISGAGSTFAAPVYEQWAEPEVLLRVTVNYQPVGSGAGITALAAKTVDFGASDPPLKPADEAAIGKNGSPAVQIPMFLGAITVSYNVPGLKTGVKLEGKTISEIFMGKIKA